MIAKRNVASLCKASLLSAFLIPTSVWARSRSSILAFNEGVKLFNAKQFNEAIPQFDAAIAGDGDFAEAYFARGACKYYLKSLDGAILDLNDALRLKSDYVDAMALRGAVNYESDRWDEALEDFNAVLVKNPKDAQSLLGRAVILLKREDLARAARDFRGFLRVRPEDPLAPKVRQLLASLSRKRPESPAEEDQGAAQPRAETAASSSIRSASHGRVLSSVDMQKIADSLLNHPLAESYDQKVLRGEGAQAVGDIHSVPGVPAEQKNTDTGVEIVEPK